MSTRLPRGLGILQHFEDGTGWRPRSGTLIDSLGENAFEPPEIGNLGPLHPDGPASASEPRCTRPAQAPPMQGAP